jgi:formylglycine-generating enzyme required for sulfatase activity
VATVTNGVVSAVAAGTATITVTTVDDGKTAACAVTVSSIAVMGVSLNPDTLSLVVGGTGTLTAAVTPSNATNQNITWSSNNTNVATVTNGVVSAVAVGTATITVTTVDGGKTAACTVTVSLAVIGVSLNTDKLSLVVGGTGTLTAVITPSNATNQTVFWSSNNPAAATVANGVVSAVAAGTATITVTTVDGGKTANCTVTVTPVPGAQSSHAINGVNVPFIYVPGGSFQRDGTSTNVSIITNGYWMGETEVTQELFQAVMGTNPSYFDGSSGGSPYSKDTPAGETQNQRPVEAVNWYDAIAFCNKLSLLDGKDPVYSVSGITDWAGLAYTDIPTVSNTTWNAATMNMSADGYRLPTEMEWMWAAMGADTTNQPNTTGYVKAFAGYNGSNNVDDYAWYHSNSGSKTHQVGKKTENELGLKDMSGNVFEWCWDRYSSYPAREETDYTGASSGSSRVIRGGGWSDAAGNVRSANRSGYTPSGRSYALGFRLVRPQF